MISNLTIPALKTLVSDMNIRSHNGDMTIPSKARKADIVAMITEEIERLHSEAIAEHNMRREAFLAEFDKMEIANDCEPFGDEMRADAQTRRVSNYMLQRKTYRLTAAQWRRIRKNNRKHGLWTGVSRNGVRVGVNY